METKICTKCGKPKLLNLYYTKKGKYIARCKKCVGEISKIYSSLNKEKRQKTNKTWRTLNKEHVAQALVIWKKNNKTQLKETTNKWRKKNKLRINSIALKSQKKVKLELTDGYIKRLLTQTWRTNNKQLLKTSDITEDIIKLKRKELQFTRKLKQLNII